MSQYLKSIQSRQSWWLRENAAGTYEIIDGLQRLHAIVSFVENSFPTLEGKYFEVASFLTAKSRAKDEKFEPVKQKPMLKQKEVSTLLDYSLAMSVMRGASEAEVNDVFDRINTYGHRLSDQERRQAGVQNGFSDMVRTIACTMRGDVSADILPLESMPSISIDLPMTKHGYSVQAEDVFWVSQGVLRSTDLRDSMDEQCIADIAACIVGGEIIERSKDALDAIYFLSSPESERIENALEVYGKEKFSEEFKYCVDVLLTMCNSGSPTKLREIIYKKNTNPFPAVFAVLLVAFHEVMIKGGKIPVDYEALKRVLTNLDGRIETSRRSTTKEERRKNIDTIKGLIDKYFVEADIGDAVYGNHAATDIEAIIRRSEVELSDYELKQGLVTLHKVRAEDKDMIHKIVCTICAIANNGHGRVGKIILGVTDKDADAVRVRELDKIEPKKIGRRYVVGVEREAKVLGISMEKYISKWKDGIRSSDLSQPLKDSVLSSIDFNSFYGLGVIVITVPAQSELSYVGEDVYWRAADGTEKVEGARQIASLAGRFKA
ncbi:GmrSD restriction endonuclease domain-containing protein [Variovorax boronicumulans]|uniref:GmrSD restriction endonuclease domain-containing protein n=1 Tax=Variovorax boronicumulans TaxID=436515 RepID=UPI0012E5C53B|nr:DUF262 domain-containing protein [Variovorax boronicumulans]GER17414.1 DUF262 domain-containing protein [Variovorax boronicumulans]